MARLFKIFFILLLVVSVAAAIYGWVRNRKSDDGGLKIVEVKTGSITEKALAVGQIEPRQKFQVKSKISGIVKRCYVEVGDTVKAGDSLFEISPDPTPQELINVDRTLDSSKATLDRTKADFARYQKLFHDGVVSKGDLDGRREAYELARVAFNRARENRELTMVGKVSGGGAGMEAIIRAPAGGTILSRSVNPGDPVVPLTSYQAGTELASIADMHDLIFKGTVDEIDVGKMKVGMTAHIKVGALPTDVVTGRVSRIAPQAVKQEGSTLFDVEIELAPNSKVILRAGYSANADVVIREKKDIPIIPERLVSFKDGGKEAFVETPATTKDAEPKEVPVKLGLSDGLNIEIVSGLKPGDKVIQRPPKEIS